jgi:transcriptional regulator with XRE-family HTH domain
MVLVLGVLVSELAKLRRSKGFSQRGLAEEAGVSPSSVYEIEAGRRKANPSTLRKIAGALGVEVVDLLEEAERPKAPSEPLSFSRWLEERFGHSYLALSVEEIEELFEGLYGREDEEERKRELLSAIHTEYLATTKTRRLPAEQRVLVRGHHKEATTKWLLAQTASGQAERLTEEFDRSIKEVLEAAAMESEIA